MVSRTFGVQVPNISPKTRQRGLDLHHGRAWLRAAAKAERQLRALCRSPKRYPDGMVV